MMSKTSTAAFANTSKSNIFNNGSAPDPSEFFEAPQVEIDKFDRKFSKTALRQYKYPKVELDRHNRMVVEFNKKQAAQQSGKHKQAASAGGSANRSSNSP